MIPIQDTAERRVSRRWHLILYLRVYDQDTRALVGHLVDISETGVRLIRDTPLEPGCTVSMRMSWRDEADVAHHLRFVAECVWSGPDVNPDFHDVGFRFTRIEPRAIRAIGTLVQALGLRGR